MAIKATATNAVWQAEGMRCGRVVTSETAPDWMKKQVAISVRCYEKRTDRQARAWIDGYLRVVGY